MQRLDLAGTQTLSPTCRQEGCRITFHTIRSEVIVPTFRRGIFRLLLVLALLCMAGGAPVVGAEPLGRMSWREYGTDQGLRNLSVWALCQDRRGFVWVGTEDGLHRFDGARFEVFFRRDGLPSSQILTLQENPDGTIWVGTYRGLARWSGNGFLPVGTALPGLAQPIQALALGPNGALCVGTAAGLFRQVLGDQFEAFPGWSGGAVTALASLPDKDGLCVAVWNGSRAHVLVGGRGTWRTLPGPPEFGRERLDALAVDGKGTLWARSLGALWQVKEGRFERAAVHPKPTRQRAALHADLRGRLWIPGEAELLSSDPEGFLREGPTEGWPRRLVRAACVDREGSLWVGGEGLRRAKGRGLWRTYGQEEGLKSPYVWSIWRDRKQRLYAGTEKGLACLGPERWQMIPGTEGTQVRSIVQGPEGALYLSGSPWILRWDPSTGRIKKFGPEAGVKANGRIFRLLFDRQGTLWVATDSGGLLRGKGQGERWAFVPEPLPGGSPQESIEDLHEDANGRLWVSGLHGLALREEGSWRRFTHREGLRREGVAFTRSLKNGDLLVAYFDSVGLARARYEQGRFRVVEHFDHLLDPSRLIYLIGEDARGNLWVGCGRGVDVVTPTGQTEHFTVADGLAFDNTNNMAFLAEPNGDVWIGTTEGLSRFDASGYEGPPRPPLLEVIAFTLGKERFHAVPVQPLVVPAQDNTFEVFFANLSFIHEQDLRLEVRLEGLEKDWHSARGLSERYPGLAAGNYVFQARSRIGAGAWTRTPPLTFRVLPAWWASWPFQILWALGGVGFVLGFLRWRLSHLHALNAALEAKVKERTVALDASEKRAWEAFSRLQTIDEQKNQFFGIVAHDLRSPLNAIVMAAQLLQEENDLKQVEATAQKIARQGLEMSELISRFLDVSALESGQVTPELRNFALEPVVLEVLDLHRLRAQEKGIHLGFEPGQPDAFVYADEKFTKAILDNLISNAIKYSPVGTEARLTIQADQGVIRVSVADQGPGLNEADQEKLFRRFAKLSARPTGGEKSTGLGLSIVKHMADAMGCGIGVDSTPGQGATFIVAFPRGKAPA